MSAGTLLLSNVEGLTDYDVAWPREHRSLTPGTTAVLRVKNEARSLPWVLPPLFRAVQRVVVVDNQSTDGTPEVAREVAAACGAAERLLLTAYPFEVSRCGEEHLNTPESSVRNLAYFYNWSFGHVTTSYSMKWDGDMVLTAEGVDTFADLSWQLQEVEAVVSMPRHPLFVESDRVAWLDVHMVNVEEYVFPMGEQYRHVKAYEWEMRMVPRQTPRMRLPEGLCLELKYLDSDEFAHWAGADAFGATERTMRKLREWEVFHALRDQRYDEIAGVVRIEAPAAYDHVITYATERWLPEQTRPITVPLAEREPPVSAPAASTAG